MPRQAREREEMLVQDDLQDQVEERAQEPGQAHEPEQGPEPEQVPRSGRSRGLNQVTLVGRLARDPELRMTKEGVPRSWFVVAVGRGFAARDGERDADFINVVTWRQLAEVVSQHLTKGRLVGITGRLQVNRIDDGSGKPRTSTEVVADSVVFLDAPRRDKEEEAGPTTQE